MQILLLRDSVQQESADVRVDAVFAVELRLFLPPWTALTYTVLARKNIIVCGVYLLLL